MILWSGIGLFLIFLAVCFAAFAWFSEFRLASPEESSRSQRWMIRWAIQGLLTPGLIWIVMNVGLSFDIGSFMPPLQKAQGTALWWPMFCGYAGAGLVVISTYWSAVTLFWILWRAGAPLKGELWAHFRWLCGMSLGVMTLPVVLILWIGGWLGGGLAAIAVLAPIAGYAPTILRPARMPPLYARAVARLKFGKYSEAEEEIIKQLEKREDDFDGWLMLADLYANQFNDINEAEQTILEICDQPRTTSAQVSIALHKLADWYLKLKGDPDAARRALEVIVQRLPGTHLARMARLRAEQLPRTAEELREQQINKPVYLPALHDPLDEARNSAEPKTGPAPDLAAARQRGAQLEARVKADPTDPAPREELARLLAGALAQPELAILQVEQLLGFPNQSREKRAAWVGLIATWQIENLRARELGRATLRRIILDFPETPTAFLAQRRLLHLDLEVKLEAARKNPPRIPRISIETDRSP